MSQQGGRPARHDDDWWGELYDDSTEDTGPTPAPDSLDDRFTSARNAVGERPGGRDAPGEPGGGEESGAATAHQEASPGRPPVERTSPGPVASGERAVPVQRVPGPPDAPPAVPPTPSTAPAHPPVVPPGAPASPPQPPAAPPEPPAVPAAPPGPSAAPPEPPAVPPGPSAAPGEPLAVPAVPPAAPPRYSAAHPQSPAVPPGPPAAPPEPPAVPPVPSAAPAQPPVAPPGPSAASPQPQGVLPPPPTVSPAPPAFPSASATPVAPSVPLPPSALDHVGSGPPTYDPEPTALPLADPEELAEQVADTALDGARYGACTLRAVSLRGDSARYRGEPRRDALLTARFGTGEMALVLVAMATGARAAPDAHRAAAEACRLIGRAVGRSHGRLVEDIRAARRGDLKSGLQRLTERGLGRLRADAAERGLDPEEYVAGLRCLLLPADPDCRTRVFFGAGAGGLFRLRGGEWQDIEPGVPAGGAGGDPVAGFGSAPAETPEGDRLTMDFGIPVPPSPFEPAPEPPRDPFRFRASIARPGDVLVMATGGLAEPLRGEPALCAYLARRWSGRTPPGLAAFLADAQVRVKGYADDRTAAAVWEA
ncbi:MULTISPECIES: protein phosphatase 2C domain-containing protein [unclassified Streptomyces]|uniref:protein phosphatase 2C domain-containing protein n=1 Tax=unclassified Streptomyces TaxID=2593676 RepID=UPI0036A8C926